jgi:hypothetical protein
MKRTLLGMGFAGLVALACSSSTDTRAPVVLQVSQIDAPGSVATGSSFAINLTVEVGNCLAFDHIEVVKSASDIVVTVWGTDLSKLPGPTVPGVGLDLACAPPNTEVRPLTVQAGSSGTLTLEVERGRLSPLIATVQVQ